MRQCARISAASSREGLKPARQRHERLRHGVPQRIGARHDGGLGDRGILDQHALELERTQPVIRRLEHIVGAPDKREVAVAVARRDVAGMVIAVAHRI